jgi:6-hydroxy-3-succinoylpyridine 3-monooxygenase
LHCVYKYPGAPVKRDYPHYGRLSLVIPGRKPTIKPESWYAQPDLVDQILLLATPIVGSRGKAFKWMDETNQFLNNQAPIELAETEEGAAKVIEYIQNYIAHKAAMHNCSL